MTATELKHSGNDLRPDEGERIRIFDEEITVRVEGSQTNGEYAVLTGSVAPGGGPPLHAHPGNETFFVLSGEFAFTQRIADNVETVHGGSGTVFHAPSGVLHRFENINASRSTVLLVVSADTVDFLRELGAAFPPGAQPDMEKMLSIHAKYDVETIHGEEGSRSEPPKDEATSSRARAFAWRFEHLNNRLIETIANCTPQQWQTVCADTGWTVAVQAHHIASGAAAIVGLVRDVATGHPHPPQPVGKLDEINARHAEAFARVTVDETIALLHENGAFAANIYRTLTDEQLARSTILTEGNPPISVTGLLEQLALGEIERHGDAIRTAIGD